MGRIADAFDEARDENRAALVIYICAGDPDLATTEDLVVAAAEVTVGLAILVAVFRRRSTANVDTLDPSISFGTHVSMAIELGQPTYPNKPLSTISSTQVDPLRRTYFKR